MRPERPWRMVASLALSGMACINGLFCWWLTAPGLWELATFTPTRPIRPMGLAVGLLAGMFVGYVVSAPLSLFATKLSEHPAAQAAATLAVLATALPFLNFVLCFVIIFARGIELGS